MYLSPPAPNSLLQNPSNFGANASHWLLYFLLFFFFLIFNRMDAWSLMRGDAFIHFVSGSRRVNIRLGVLLLIPKSQQILRRIFGRKQNKSTNMIKTFNCTQHKSRISSLLRLYKSHMRSRNKQKSPYSKKGETTYLSRDQKRLMTREIFFKL